MKKLNVAGIAHLMALMIVILGVGIVGTYYLVASHADTLSSYSCNPGDILSGTTCQKATTYPATATWTCPNSAPYLNANGSCYPNNPPVAGTAVNHQITYVCSPITDTLSAATCTHNTNYAAIVTTTTTAPNPATTLPTATTSPSGNLACMSATTTSNTIYISYSNAGTEGTHLYRYGAASYIASYSGASGTGSHTDTGLNPGSAYSYQLRSGTTVIANISCTTSATSTVKTPAPATTPSTTATSTSPGGSLACMSSTPTSNTVYVSYSNTGTAGAHLYRYGAASFIAAYSAANGSGSHPDTDLSPASQYNYQLRSGTTVLANVSCTTAAAKTSPTASTPTASANATNTSPAVQTTCAPGYERAADGQCGTPTKPSCPAGTTLASESASSLSTVYFCRSTAKVAATCPSGTEKAVDNVCVKVGAVSCPAGYSAVSSSTVSGKSGSYCKFSGCPAGTLLGPDSQCGTLKKPVCPAHTLLVGGNDLEGKIVYYCKPESAAAAAALATATTATPPASNNTDGCSLGHFKGPDGQCSSYAKPDCGPGTTVVSGTVTSGKTAYYCKAVEHRPIIVAIVVAPVHAVAAVAHGVSDITKTVFHLPQNCFVDLANGDARNAGRRSEQSCQALQAKQDAIMAHNNAQASAPSADNNASTSTFKQIYGDCIVLNRGIMGMFGWVGDSKTIAYRTHDECLKQKDYKGWKAYKVQV